MFMTGVLCTVCGAKVYFTLSTAHSYVFVHMKSLYIFTPIFPWDIRGEYVRSFRCAETRILIQFKEKMNEVTRGILKVLHIHPYHLTHRSERKNEYINVNVMKWSIGEYHALTTPLTCDVTKNVTFTLHNDTA